jgi:CRISPR-associated protein Cmr4
MYTLQRFILMTLDPVHIGAGGYRLGRVDMTIAREPGSNLPKIPGTSLAGAARSYAAMRYEKLRCAGQGDKTEKQCGKFECPICYTFGHIRGTEGGNAGTVSLADAQILLFPVHSMAGPVWVSTTQRLNDAGFAVQSPDLARGEFATTLPNWNKALNLGWLLLTWKNAALQISLPQQSIAAWETISKRLVLVEESLLAQIVNSNLEVRTSVSIDPTTGAAADKALFTYEAIPRATWLWSDVVEDDYRTGQKPWTVAKKHKSAEQKDNAGGSLGASWARPLDVVGGGLALAEHLGIGGMGTRGFGRIKVLHNWEVSHA